MGRWTNRNPADRDLTVIADEAGWMSGIDKRFEARAIGLSAGHPARQWFA
jgi:hypothetical protein